MSLPKAELRKATRANFARLFTYQSKPPDWIQSPEWPIRAGRPLRFVGQLAIRGAPLHDDGAAYVFVDLTTGDVQTVAQFY
jgi:hypothetical protein